MTDAAEKKEYSFNKNYPRDLIGYGAHPPHAAWPNNARVAVQFVLNYEEGAENSVLHGDTAGNTLKSLHLCVNSSTVNLPNWNTILNISIRSILS